MRKVEPARPEVLQRFSAALEKQGLSPEQFFMVADCD